MKRTRQTLLIIGLALAIFISGLIVVMLILSVRSRPISKTVWGVTYSASYARYLGLDDHKAYTAMLDELHPKKLRLIAYWDVMQPQPNTWNFSELDFQINEAEKRHIPYSIAVGRRLPRFPECYAPDWAKKLPISEQRQALNNQIRAVVQRYNVGSNLVSWQVENEIALGGQFGECPAFHDRGQLPSEVNAVRSLSAKDIQITNGGETLPLGFTISKYGDVFGTSLYRNSYFHGVFFFKPIPPGFYQLRALIVKAIHPSVKKVIVSELQLEPWVADKGIKTHDQAYYNKTLSPEQFSRNIGYAQRTNMPEVDLWGVEWWYYMKTQRGNDAYWQRAQDVFSQSATLQR